MSRILLVEPDYRTKFPPLGLMRISTFHNGKGDDVTYVRGKSKDAKAKKWDRIYISSLFTYELPRTVATASYYSSCVRENSHIIIGGIGATLMPEYVREHTQCRVIAGPLDRPHILGGDETPIAELAPDYKLIDSADSEYKPSDAYFCRVTHGCVRKCSFCAVPVLEPGFRYMQDLRQQIREAKGLSGERQHLVLLDNNILASSKLTSILKQIRDEGFQLGATRNGRRRTVDFNQGIDARFIDARIAKELGAIALSPVRLAFDRDDMEDHYRKAIERLATVGFPAFTNYLMFNYDDTPQSLYRRMQINIELSQQLGIRVTGFPMKYAPISDVHRRHVSEGWNWRYLRGIQCVLLATRGLVSPNPKFFYTAFGSTYDEFLEILSMPDRYIIFREDHANNGAEDWRKAFTKLSETERQEFLCLLGKIHSDKAHATQSISDSRFAALLEHYYPK